MKIISFIVVLLVLVFQLSAQDLIHLENIVKTTSQDHVVNTSEEIHFLWFDGSTDEFQAIGYRYKNTVFILVNGLKDNQNNEVEIMTTLNEQQIKTILEKQMEFKETIKNTQFQSGEIISLDHTLSENCFFSLRSRSPNGDLLFLWINNVRYKPPYGAFINFLKKLIEFKDN